MSSAPGSPGSPPRSRWPTRGIAVVALRSGAAGRRALPLLFRRRARLPHRQRQSPAARRQHGGDGLSRAHRRARHVRAARPRRRSRSSISRPASAGRCGPNRGARAVVGVARRRGGCRARGRAIISRRCGCGGAGARRRRSPTVLDPDSVLFRRLWQPLAVAALNTGAGGGVGPPVLARPGRDARRGAAACRPLVPREGLSESLVDPALALLRGARRRDPLRRAAAGARLRRRPRRRARFRRRRRSRCGRRTASILAVPAAVAARLVPGLVVPDDYAPIVNAHFRSQPPAGRAAVRRASSAAPPSGCSASARSSRSRSAPPTGSSIAPAEELARRAVARCRGAPTGCRREPCRRARIVKERRATFRATPAQLRRRPADARRDGTIFTLRAIMSIPACLPRSKALFAPALPRRRWSPAASPGAGGDAAGAATPTPIEDCQRALP